MESSNIIFIDGKSYLKAKASILPSFNGRDDRNASQIYRHTEVKNYTIGYMNSRSSKDIPHRVYITSDEKILEGDRVLLCSNEVVEAINFIGHIGYKEIGGTKFKHFYPMIEKKIVTSKVSREFTTKLIETNIECINIEVFIELVGGCEEVITPTCCDEVIVTHIDKPYTIKLDSNGIPVIHTFKRYWGKEEVKRLLSKSIAECNSFGGDLQGIDPSSVDAENWMNKVLQQMDK